MKNKIFNIFKKNDFILVTISTVISAFVSFLYSVFAKRYVMPLEYGIFSTCLLLQTYLNYAQLGVLSAFNRDYPQLIGQKRREDSLQLRDTTLSYVWLIFGGIAFWGTIAIIGMYRINVLSFEYAIGYSVVLWLILIENTASFCMYTTRIIGEYNYSAIVNIVKTIVSLVIGLIAVVKWGYYGLFFMPLVGAGISILMYWKCCMKDFRFALHFKVLKNSALSGLPLMLNSFVWTVMQSIDKFVILAFMDTEALGIYTVPLLGFSTMVLIPQTISQVFYNKISILYGETKNEILLIKKCEYYTWIVGICAALVSVVAYYILPIFVEIVMPNYKDGVGPAQILIIGVAIYSTTMLYSNVFSVLKLNRDLLLSSVIVCLFNVIFSVGFVLLNGREIGNVAFGTSVSYVMYSFTLLFWINKKFGVKMKGLLSSSWMPLFLIIIPPLVLYYSGVQIVIAFIVSIIWVLIMGGIFYKKKIVDDKGESYE